MVVFEFIVRYRSVLRCGQIEAGNGVSICQISKNSPLVVPRLEVYNRRLVICSEFKSLMFPSTLWEMAILESRRPAVVQNRVDDLIEIDTA